MNLIPSERGLAHWRSLAGLSPFRTRRLQERLQQEHPELVRFVTAVLWERNMTTVVPVTAPLVTHPRKDRVEVVLSFAAALNELFRREAGYPLRPVRWNDLHHAWSELQGVRFQAADPEVEPAPTLLSHCRQKDLICGVIIAYVSSYLKDTDGDTSLLLAALVKAFDLAATETEPTPGSNNWTADRIEDALSVQGDPLRHEALEAAAEFRAELTPRFVAEIDQWGQGPSEVDDVSFGLHGLYQLAVWREPTAWPAFRSLFSQPNQETYEWIGETLAENRAVLLASVVGQRVHELRELFENPAVISLCRNAALEALGCLVAWGEYSREELTAYLQELLDGRLTETDQTGHAIAIHLACQLEAWNLLPRIESAFTNDRVDPRFFTMDDLEYERGREPGSAWAGFVILHPQLMSAALATEWLHTGPSFDEKDHFGDEEDEDLEPPPGLISGSAPYLAPEKVGRNDPCPCGSGRKFKKCCG